MDAQVFLSDLLDVSQLPAVPWAEIPSSTDVLSKKSALFPQPALSGLFLHLRSPSEAFELHSSMSQNSNLAVSLSQRIAVKSPTSAVRGAFSLHSQHRVSLRAEMDVPSVGTFTLSALECGQKAVGIAPNARVGFKGTVPVPFLPSLQSSVEVGVDVVNGPSVDLGLVAGTPSFCVGVGGRFNTGVEYMETRTVQQKVEKLVALARYVSSDVVAVASVRDLGNVWRCHVRQKVAFDFGVGSEVEYQRKRRTVTLKGQCHKEINTRESLFGSLDSEGIVGVAYRCRLSPFLQVALSGRVNLLQLETDSHQVGLTFQIG
ncbi:hypothetical protein H257_06664 [Aphanomyces astaci]|uniref:Uncharacterized protein n=1 Tax=Aphanomyces astaci TaxID=112090 RepID=W4GLW3_APHAT|nr:hypothetical protein H257_06664 [Aphanomyces astaci]ETV80356.1 hypothetical protein H257_06664 [Aphanomyces astaci]RQM27972.1 hypothetical protein B5M09_001901 [Aphanomyces astaci]|eukprot:XP_009830280.1 hypothetical protein H257_06664 [Aphanomyces astaci]